MKEKLKKVLFSPALRNGLCACMALSWWLNASRACLFLFGEVPYPEESDC